jgi:peroxiredoxin
MGTWCPNCTDETNTFKELYKEYQSKGLEFIAIGFENGKEEDCYALLKKFKEKKNIQYTVLYGGNAKRATADIIFTMLDGVKSFPTTIYIGKDGLIKKVYSGFNGPGTGEYYDQYLEQTKKLIEEMVR